MVRICRAARIGVSFRYEPKRQPGSIEQASRTPGATRRWVTITRIHRWRRGDCYKFLNSAVTRVGLVNTPYSFVCKRLQVSVRERMNPSKNMKYAIRAPGAALEARSRHLPFIPQRTVVTGARGVRLARSLLGLPLRTSVLFSAGDYSAAGRRSSAAPNYGSGCSRRTSIGAG